LPELPLDAATPEAVPATAAAPVHIVDTLGGARSFIGVRDAATLGTLIDTVDNRVLMAEGEPVFLEMDDLAAVKPGQHLQLLELGAEVRHPLTGQPIGFQVNHLGVAEVTEITPSVAVATVLDSTREIQRGARVRPFVELPAQIPLQPCQRDLHGYIVAADEGKIALSQLDVIHVDLGAAAGLEIGNELEIFRPRTFARSARPIKQLDADNFVELPDVQLGTAMVIALEEDSAAALVRRVANQPIYRGDQVRTVTH
jgi:hypothetical protein